MDDNIHNLRDALEWLDRRIREEAEYDGEMSNEHAIELAFIQNMLAKFPLRQCDVGTPEEQGERCLAQFNEWRRKSDGKMLITAIMAWAQTPYEAEEGDAK